MKPVVLGCKTNSYFWSPFFSANLLLRVLVLSKDKKNMQNTNQKQCSEKAIEHLRVTESISGIRDHRIVKEHFLFRLAPPWNYIRKQNKYYYAKSPFAMTHPSPKTLWPNLTPRMEHSRALGKVNSSNRALDKSTQKRRYQVSVKELYCRKFCPQTANKHSHNTLYRDCHTSINFQLLKYMCVNTEQKTKDTVIKNWRIA